MEPLSSKPSSEIILSSSGETTECVQSQSLEQLLKKANVGDLPSQLELGDRLFSHYVNHNVEDHLALVDNQKQIVNDIEQAASKANVQAQFILGCLLDQGEAVTEDKPLALDWYQKAAKENHLGAKFQIGIFYQNGWGGLEADDVKALKYYLEAMPNPAAIYEIGFFHSKGLGGLYEDKAAALAFYQMAAELQFPPAICQVGKYYAQGKGGLTENKTEALKYYRKAASYGYEDAKFLLKLYEIEGIEDEALQND